MDRVGPTVRKILIQIRNYNGKDGDKRDWVEGKGGDYTWYSKGRSKDLKVQKARGVGRK